MSESELRPSAAVRLVHTLRELIKAGPQPRIQRCQSSHNQQRIISFNSVAMSTETTPTQAQQSTPRPLHSSHTPTPTNPHAFPPTSLSQRQQDGLYPSQPPASMSQSIHQQSSLTAGTAAARRVSVQSGRSSVAPNDTIFGTAQVGVIGKTRPREVVRIERDYSMGERCQFWSGWVWELEGRVGSRRARSPSQEPTCMR